MLQSGQLLTLNAGNVNLQSVTIDATQLAQGNVNVYAGNGPGQLLFQVPSGVLKTLGIGVQGALYVTADAGTTGQVYIQWTDQQLVAAASLLSLGKNFLFTYLVASGTSDGFNAAAFGVSAIVGVIIANFTPATSSFTYPGTALLIPIPPNCVLKTNINGCGQVGSVGLQVTAGAGGGNVFVTATDTFVEESLISLSGPYLNGICPGTPIQKGVDEQTATTIIYTVPANTTLFISSAYIAYIGAAVAGNRVFLKPGFLLELPAAVSAITVACPIPIVLTAGNAVTLDGTGGAFNATSAGFNGFTLP